MAEQGGKRIKKKLCALLVIAAAAALVLLVPVWRQGAGNVIRLLAEADLESVKAYIRSFGPWAVLVSMLLMVLQSIAAPVPAFVITLANAGVWGWICGATVSWTGAMLGAYLCFFLARFFGRDLVERLTGREALQAVDEFFTHHGAQSVFVARLLPFVPFDPISYAAGLTGMKTVPFLLATGLGQLPATLVYSYAGSVMLSGNLKLVLYGLCALMAVGGITMLLRPAMMKKRQSIAKEVRK